MAEPGYMAPKSELLTTILYCLSGGMASHSRVEDGETLREEGRRRGWAFRGERDGRGQGPERERERRRGR